jgi:two-component system sensor histidine kinase/response regulator
MKHEHKFIVFAVLCGLGVWVLDGMADYLYYKTSLLTALLTGIPTHEIVARVAALIGFVIFGLLISNAAARQRQADRLLEQRYAESVRLNATLRSRNEELDAFAHTVAHDLKNPLGLVILWTETLQLDYADLSDEQRMDYLEAISQSGRKMNSIIDELLLLASVRSVDAKIGPLDMDSIVAEAQRRLVPLIEERQAEIVLPAESEWPVALGYAPWIEEVWVNYLSNAIKYGGGPPRVELGAEIQPDGMARFWVRDNGAGLAPEDQARLFTPFTRLNQVRVKGYGLGLSIVRRIVEKLDGQVGITSQAGHGSIFSFTLPAESSQATGCAIRQPQSARVGIYEQDAS